MPGHELSRTLFYEYQTLGALAEYLIAEYPQECLKWTGLAVKVEGRPEISLAAVHVDVEFPELTSWKTGKKRTDRLSVTGAEPRESIAIIGISGHYPQAKTLTTFWENLQSGKDCIREIPEERWPLEGFYHPDPQKAVS